MKALIGIVFAIVVVVGLLVAFIWWLVASTNDQCYHWKQTVVSVSRNDPQDLPGVLDMYTDDCS